MLSIRWEMVLEYRTHFCWCSGGADVGWADGLASGSWPFVSAPRGERLRAAPVPGVRRKAVLGRAARGDTPVRVNPVPRGLMTRRQGGTMRSRMAPLVRVPRTLPRILSPEEADRLVGALRTHRDRAMVLGMLLAGLRRCEVLGLRFEDVQVADRRLAVVEGKGGHHRVVPAANRFFDALGAYLHHERPGEAPTDRVFVVLKGPRRGLPLSAEGLDEILAGARRRAGLEHGTCHELRHTCLTRLREAGMALEAVQAQAGHASIAAGPGLAAPGQRLAGRPVPACGRADRCGYRGGRRDAGRERGRSSVHR